MKNAINKGILFDLFILIYCLFELIISKYVDMETFNITKEFAISMLILGVILLIIFLIRPEDEYGQSKKYDLIIGLFYLIIGPIIFYLSTFLTKYNILISILAVIHGLGKIFYNNHRGIILRMLEMFDGIFMIIFGVLVANIFKIDYFNDLHNYWYIYLALVVVDLIILILAQVLPRDDLENKNKQINYSSQVDRVFIKEKRKINDDEVIDLDKLFNINKEKE